MSACPPWCAGQHIPGTPHRSKARSVSLGLEGAGLTYVPELVLQLEHEHDDDRPAIVLRLDGTHVACLTADDARHLGAELFAIAHVAGVR
ncbi:MAG TPA: hypothetical protein VFV66_24410 [Nonomuraea sp.]|nr:hypothetical protein [Nonomuraea sp.]